VSWYLAVTAGLWLLLFTLQAIIPFAPRTTPSNTTNIGGLQYSSPLPGEGPETTIQQREFQTAEALFKRLQKYNGDVAAIPGMPGSGQYQAGLDWTKDELLGDYHYNFLPTILAIRQDAIRAGDKAWHDTDFYEQGQMDIGRIRIVAADLASRAVQ